MNLIQIKYFLEVSKTLNFTNAAQNLFVSQPSFSRQIQLLEEELGVKLLIRNNRKVVLTKAGKVFEQRFQGIMSDIDFGIEEVKKAGNIQQEIRIGIFHPITNDVIDFLMEKFRGWFENEKILIYKYRMDELKEAFDKGKIDIVISLGAFDSFGEDTESHVLKKIRAGVVCSKELAKMRKAGQSFSDWLSGKKYIGIEENFAPGLVEYQLAILDKLQIKQTEVVRAGDIINTLLHVYPGEGYAIFFENEELVESEKIEFIPIDQSEIYFRIMIYWKKDKVYPFEKLFQTE